MTDPAISRRLSLGLLAAAAATPVLAQSGRAAAAWSTAWAATLQRQVANAPSVTGRTVRVKTLLSAGGSELRVRISNGFGAKPLRIGAASILAKGRIAPLTFSGTGSIVAPVGAVVISDAVKLATDALEVVEISLFLPDDAAAETYQRGPAAKGAVISEPGDFTGQATMPQASETYPSFVSAVEVGDARAKPGLVIFGDTKSAGPGTWPDFLVELARGRIAVANRSQYAGLMALGPAGDSGLARFDRDVLTVAGATHLLLFNGNNDLIQPGTVGSNGRALLDAALTQTTEQLIDAQEQIALRARAAGLQVIGGAWLPYDGVPIEGYSTPEKAAKRKALNAWMRASPLFDKVIDFDAALRDPAAPGALAPAFDSGNHFTPSEAGYRRMAEAAWAVLKSVR